MPRTLHVLSLSLVLLLAACNSEAPPPQAEKAAPAAAAQPAVPSADELAIKSVPAGIRPPNFECAAEIGRSNVAFIGPARNAFRSVSLSKSKFEGFSDSPSNAR